MEDQNLHHREFCQSTYGTKYDMTYDDHYITKINETEKK